MSGGREREVDELVNEGMVCTKKKYSGVKWIYDIVIEIMN